METEIYFGPTYYLRLKHMPKDKINYRARGPRTALTRQTVQGRANNGGLRIGEMDRDCLIGHGISHFVKESMMVRGDQFKVAVCNKTGCVAVYNESNNIFLSPMADGPVKFTGNLVDDLNVINVSKYGRDFSIINVPYAFKLLIQELQTMNVQMRVITEDNVDQLMSLTKGDDVEKLTHQRFFNLEQVRNHVNSQEHQLKNKAAPIIKEKTPEPEAYKVPDWLEWQDDTGTPVSMTPEDDDGTSVQVNLRKDQYRHEPGDIVVFESDTEPRERYEIIKFDPEEMKYITQAVSGDFKGKYRDSWEDELITPEPESPDYNLYGPPGATPDPDSPDFFEWQKQQEAKKLAEEQGFREYAVKEDEPLPLSVDSTMDEDDTPQYPQRPKQTLEESDSPDVVYERELGSASKEKEEDAENILKTVSSINDKKINKGLDLLVPKEEDEGKKDEDEDEDDSSKTKKIT